MALRIENTMPATRETFLKIAGTDLDDGFPAFLSVLPAVTPVLDSLNLSSNCLSSTQWIALAQFLPHFTCLHKLGLDYTSLRSDIVLVDLRALSHVQSLTCFSLAGAYLGVSERATWANPRAVRYCGIPDLCHGIALPRNTVYQP